MRKFLSDILVKANLGVEQNAYVLGTVGIGTSSPTYKLQLENGSQYIVGGLGAINSSPYTSANRLIFNNDYNDIARGPNKITLYDGSWLGGFGIHNNTMAYYSGGVHEWYLATNASNPASLMTLLANGNLGIGTTSPGWKLDVIGDVRASSYFVGGSSGQGFSWGNFTYGSYIDVDNGQNALRIRNTSGTIMLEVNGGSNFFTGNLGVGTNSPSYKFVVNESTTNPIAYFGTAPLNASSRNSLIILQSGTIPQSGSDTTGEVGFLFKHSYGTGGVNGTANGGYIESIRESVFGITSQVNTALIFGTSAANTDGERMRITSSGNVGIGTTNPNALLVLDSGEPRFRMNIAGTNHIIMNHDGTTGVLRTESATPLTFGTNGSERMRITSGGNVGIGTTTPNYKLHVSGNVYINETLFVNQLTTVEDSLIVYDNLGVGTTTPTAFLHIAGQFESNYALKLSGTYGTGRTFGWKTNGGDSNVISLYDVTQGSRMAFFGYTQIGFEVNGVSRLYIADGGNIGIGTTSPTDKLQVVASTYNGITITTPDVATFKMRSSSGATTSWGFATTNLAASDFGIYQSNSGGGDPINAGTARLYFNGSGNVGIGTTSPATKLHLTGTTTNITITDTTYSRTSNIGYLDSANLYFANDNNSNTYIGRYNGVFLAYGGGNVGVGTTSPTAKLHIAMPDVASAANPVTGSGWSEYFWNQSSAPSDATRVLLLDTTSNTASSRVLGIGFAPGYTGHQNWGIYASAITGGSANEGNLHFVSQDNSVTYRDVMTMLANGNVLIGNTTDAGYKLDVNGTGRFSSSVNASNFYASTGFWSDAYDVRRNGFYADGTNLIFRAGTSTEQTRLTISQSTGAATFSSSVTATQYNISNSNQTISIANTSDIQINAAAAGSNILFRAAGDERMRITSGGNVGIGTTSPTHKLTVVGDGSGTMKVGGPGVSGNYTGISLNGSLDISNYNILSSPTDNHLYINRPTGNNIYFRVNNNDQVIINSSGNVGIGTSSPSQKLHLYGSGNQLLFIENSSTYQLYTGIASNVGIVGSNNATPLSLQTNGVSRVYLDTSGNVGIGTTSPFNKLTVGSVPASGYGLITISADWASGSAISTGIKIGAAADTGGAGVDIRSHSNYAATSGTEMSFWTNSTPGNVLSERMRITNAGNIGIGTTSPNAKLEVANGFVRVTGTETDQYFFEGIRPGVSATLRIYDNASNLYYDSYSSMIFRANQNGGSSGNILLFGGNVGIGTSSPVEQLTISGTGSRGIGVSTITSGDPYVRLYDNTSAKADIWWGRSGNYMGVNSIGAGSITAINPFGGNVGIGTTSPGAMLDIYHATNGYASVGLQGYSTAAKWFLTSGISGDTIQDFSISHNNNGTSPVFRLSNSTGAATFSSSVTASSFGGNSYPYNSILGSGADASTGTIFAGSTSGYASSIDVAGGGAANPNTIIFKTASTEKMRITTGGNVGIGTSTGHYFTTNRTVLNINGTSSSILGLQAGNTTAGYLYSDANDFTISTEGTRNLNLVTAGNAPMVFQTNTTEKMRITSAGNVGIGTTSPGKLLSVGTASGTGDIGVAGDIWIGENSHQAGGGNMFIAGSGTGDRDFNLNQYNGSAFITNFFVNGGNGNVGIGTTSPSAKLHTQGTGPVFVAQSTDDTVPARVVNLSSAVSTIGFQANGSANSYNVRVGCDVSDFIAYTNNTERMRITSGGNVGIGTSDPSVGGTVGSKFTIIQSDNSTAIAIYSGTSRRFAINPISNGGFTLFDGGSATFNSGITQLNGNVGIGTTSPDSALEVNGRVSIRGANELYFGQSTSGIGTWTTRMYASGSTHKFNASTFIFNNEGYGGSEYMRITSAGNIGVNTTTPYSGTGVTSVTINASSYPILAFQNNGSRTGDLIGYYNHLALNTPGFIALSPGDSEAMRITTGGNVGIGNTSPQARLDLGSSYGANGEKFLIYNDNNSSALAGTKVGFYMDRFGLSNNSTFVFPTDTVGNPGSYIIASKDTSGTTLVARMAVLGQSGNVGIGTASPLNILHVSQPSAATVLRIGNNSNYDQSIYFNGGNDWSMGMDYSNSNAFVLSNYSSLGTNDRLVVTTGGNVGIGTTSPGARLTVQTTTASSAHSLRITDGTGDITIGHWDTVTNRFEFSGKPTSFVQYGTGNYISFGTLGSENIRIAAGGNVGIGTTSPGVKLEVVGAIRGGSFPAVTTNSGEAWFGRASDRTLGTMTFQLGGSSATNTHFEIVDRAWSKVMYGLSGEAPSDSIRVTSSGNVGFGTGSPSYKLHVEGNVSGISIYASHDIAAFSDITVKKEVKKIKNAIEKVKELNGYTYVRTDDETGTRRAGVIAQEVQKVLPEVVSANPDGTLNVAYSNMVALLIEAIKEQQNEIDELKKLLKK